MCRDPGTQWMVVVCLVVYLATFLVLERRVERRAVDGTDFDAIGSGVVASHPSPLTPLPVEGRGEPERWRARLFRLLGDPDVWRFGLVGIGLGVYALDYAEASRSMQLLVLLAGITMGKGVAVWGRVESKVQSPRSKVQGPKSKVQSLDCPRHFGFVAGDCGGVAAGVFLDV